MCFCRCHSTRPNNKYNSDAYNEAEKQRLILAHDVLSRFEASQVIAVCNL